MLRRSTQKIRRRRPTQAPLQLLLLARAWYGGALALMLAAAALVVRAAHGRLVTAASSRRNSSCWRPQGLHERTYDTLGLDGSRSGSGGPSGPLVFLVR